MVQIHSSPGAPESGLSGPRIDVVAAAAPHGLQIVGIVHDLGNLIQVASSALTLAARRPSESTAMDLAPLIAGARSALGRAGILVRQTIGFARNGATVLERLSVPECLAELGQLVQHTLSSDIRLNVQTNSESLAVTANRLGFQNAILNLVLNARDAMPDGGLISILARESYDASTGATVEIRVTDTGVGMTQDTISRIFDPYFTTKDVGLGGVGLPMVKRFAEDAGGSIGIASAPGVGTTATLRLPAATAFSAMLSSVLNSASSGNEFDHITR